MWNQVVILSIGDELLIGNTINTNAAWLSSRLDEDGFEVVWTLTVRDRYHDIHEALELASSKADIVICTGGMGPTDDDVTKQVICDYFNTELTIHKGTLARIKDFFASRGLTLSQRNHDQAMVPADSDIMPNNMGTAPGIAIRKDGKRYFFLPGVPFEMEYLYEKGVRPIISSEFSSQGTIHMTVLTHGIGESFLSDKLGSFEKSLPAFIRMAYLPSPGIVKLRLTARGSNREELMASVEKCRLQLKEKLGHLIFGYGDDTMESSVGELLLETGYTISIAESCTGGTVSQMIASVPGASRYFLGSVIAYSNEVKKDTLGVDPETIEKYGAVSEEVAKQMAQNVRRIMNSDYGLATTGIAGPDGGSPEKPVGTVFLALAGPGRTVVIKHMFGNHRGRNILRSSLAMLNMLRLELQNTRN